LCIDWLNAVRNDAFAAKMLEYEQGRETRGEKSIKSAILPLFLALKTA
jgi:hypothetical protein